MLLLLALLRLLTTLKLVLNLAIFHLKSLILNRFVFISEIILHKEVHGVAIVVMWRAMLVAMC